MNAARGTCAVIVTYRPEAATLRSSLQACREQADAVFVFDNASPADAFDGVADVLEGVELRRSATNIGLAAGFNRGIDFARDNGFRFVLLLDQDSVPGPGMVAALRDAFDALSPSQRVAAVGTVPVDARNGLPAPFVRIGFPFNRKRPAGPGERVECDFLISSGSLIPLAALDAIGGMDEGLFIDNVDLDWCFRARARGFALFGVGAARMRHAIGDALRPSSLQRGGAFVHQPVRLYYIMRNRLLLYRRAATPMAWIGQDLLRLPLKFIATLLFQRPRRRYLERMLSGLRDGLRGVDGPAPH